MLTAGSGLSLLPEPMAAGNAAAQMAVTASAGPVSSILVFASFHHAAHLAQVLAGVREVTGDAPIHAACGYGVLTEQHEIEDVPAVAVLAIAGDHVTIEARQIRPDDAQGEALGRLLAAEADTRKPSTTVLLLGPDAGWPEEILQGHAAGSSEGGSILGVGLSGVWQDSAVASDDEVREDASLALFLPNTVQVRIGHSRALGPLGRLHTVTHARGDRIDSLDGQPARAVLLAEAGEALLAAMEKGDVPLYVGIPSDGATETLHRNAYAVRSVLGIDKRDGSVIVPQGIPAGTAVGFLIQDRERAKTDFQDLLQGLVTASGDRQPAFGLYFNCVARGRDLYGAPDVDVQAIRQQFPGLPLIGISGAFELCPVDGVNGMHSYTGVLALISPC